MPSFTARIPNLQSTGPIIEALIWPPSPLIQKLKAEGQPVPSPVKVLALIDTGATSSVVDPGVIEQIGLSPTGEVNISTPTAAAEKSYSYYAAIGLPNNVIVETSSLLTAKLPGQPIQCLIGRDILRHGVLVYNGYDESVTLSI